MLQASSSGAQAGQAGIIGTREIVSLLLSLLTTSKGPALKGVVSALRRGLPAALESTWAPWCLPLLSALMNITDSYFLVRIEVRRVLRYV